MPLLPEFTLKALEDLSSIQAWTQARFGDVTSLHYDELLEHALADLLDEPTRLGVKTHAELPQGVFLYHLRFSRLKMKPGAIEKPRHLIVFRVSTAALTVLRVLHDSMDLPAQLDDDNS
jgi:toxin ParE1/3/4